MTARLLPIRTVEKIWGRTRLPAPFSSNGEGSIGEIWFEPQPEISEILIKYLFTSEKLSVQVHPSDSQSLAGEAGKEECWLVIDAEPGARLAIGFEHEVTSEEIEEAARDGSIEKLLTWHPAKAGDFFYLPAGTVHAIGPGLSLVEIQQASETTFRLYDYGRDRELHLERGLAVAHRGSYARGNRRHIDDGQVLVDGPYFRVDRIEGAPDTATVADFAGGAALVLPLSGDIRTKDYSARAEAGQCLMVDNLSSLDFTSACVTLLVKPAYRSAPTA